ncbi:hypothetical protein [Psychrobacter sp. I-STPA6b]|uniref:hypothetical protein n=1 Tax=Psychrobacter sp. I-STPA6b TaxID=2585718 RepID=UPI001D0CB9D3|nr:hypothetical protein [Psychrobacter sp. I-STPA6b]
MIDKATEGATINEQQGSVQNLNQGAVNQAIEAYQAQVKTYLEQNHPDATVGEVLGTSSINPYPSQMLSPILPYQVKTVISDYQTLPEGMRHYFSMSLYKNSYGLFGGSSYNNLDGPALSVKIATVDLQGKPLALSFKPATQADEDRLLGYLPKDKNGTLPNSLPTNISMTPEITLDGEVLATGGVFKLGETINGKINISSPHGNVNGGTDKEVIAGEYHAIGYDLQGLSQQQLETTKETLETTKDKLEQYQKTENQTALDGLTKHDLTGAILQAGVQSYYAVNDTQDIIAQKQAGIVQYPYLTYGTFSTNLTPEYRYGIPLSVKMGGVVMDIDKILHTKVEVNNDREKLTAYNLARGPSYSLNENLVPEQLFDNPDTPEKEADGVSAVKALSIAAQQGQTIFTVTKDNYAEVLPKLSHSDVVMRDIRNGINAGKTVTVSERPITLNGWTGTGYTILDPYSGAGAYMIGGGLDGGATFIKDSRGLGFSLSAFAPSFKWLNSDNVESMGKYYVRAKAVIANAIAQINKFYECNKEAILNFAAIIVISILIFAVLSAEAGSFGTATPIAVPIMTTLFAMYSATAQAANNQKKDECFLHRGRIQAQGQKLEESVPWARETPPTMEEGLAMLEELKAKLPKQELKIREKAFLKAQRFIIQCRVTNGCDKVSITFLVKDTRSERVDIEIRTGKAFQ